MASSEDARDLDYPYEASDEASESEFLDRSLSVWKGWSSLGCSVTEQFDPIDIDLHTAASIGQYQCVKSYVENGKVNLNRKNVGGWTALMYACYIGHDNVVNLLLDAGVDVNVQNHKGQSPLILAASCGNESVAYFLLQQGAELEARDKRGWTAIFHATYSGHQNMVNFLLDNQADMELRIPASRLTPFMEAAAAGHEIIVQNFLQHGVNINAKSGSGDTARSLALMYGHTKIVSLIDNHNLGPSSLRAEAGLNFDSDLSSSDEGFHRPRGSGANRPNRGKTRGPSIREGPEAFDKLIGKARQTGAPKTVSVVTEQKSSNHVNFGITASEVTSPINSDDHCPSTTSSGSTENLTKDSPADYEEDGSAFTKTCALTIKSSSGSSGGFAAALGLSSSEDDMPKRPPRFPPGYRGSPMSSVNPEPSPQRHQPAPLSSEPPGGLSSSEHKSLSPASLLEQQQMLAQRPKDLMSLLDDLGLCKYLAVFEDQDVDLQVFLSLTDNDLKEVGIKLFGPRRKMTNAIARWHSKAHAVSHDLEQAYADKLESEMQEMAIQLQQACERIEQANRLILQEQELRSVAEGCLNEERQAWRTVQRLATENHHCCGRLHQLLSSVRMMEEELVTRTSDYFPPPSSVQDSLTNALKEGLSLDDDPSKSRELASLTSGQLIQGLQETQKDLFALNSALMVNNSHLLNPEIVHSQGYNT